MAIAAILTVLLFGIQDADNYAVQAAYDYLFTPEYQQAYDALEHNWDRERFWSDYWARRDPTPETDYNELRENFISRVEFANNLFSRYIDFEDGWKSDMGHVFIIYGPPKDIYRSPASPTLDPTYEVWVYRLELDDESEQSVELIFQDDDDDGIYDLLTEVDFPRMIQEGTLPEVTRQAEISVDNQ